MNRQDRLRLIGDDSIRKLMLTKGGDTMEVSVTEDGRYRADVTGSISSVNHGNADSFLKEIGRTLGGLIKVIKNAHGSHSHSHGHSHDHGTGHHSH